jgi:hypothetical protein
MNIFGRIHCYCKIKQSVIPFLPLSMFILSKFGTKSVLESGCRISLVKILQKYGTTHRHGLAYSLETRWHMKIMTTAGRRVGPVNQTSARATCYFNQLTNSQIQGWAGSLAISIGPTALCTKPCGSIFIREHGLWMACEEKLYRLGCPWKLVSYRNLRNWNRN